MNLQEQILTLKEKKARQILEIEMLSVINDTVYLRFGKTCAELILKEKQLIREKKSDENS